ncbi:MAG: ankyrin repeat domain-containing protein, partial [Draconibacterium sp.]|nr:ankyrin repeat domain-containing protein [Draconibacterium sp.]
TTGRAKINILNAAIRLGNVQLFNSVVNKCGNILFSSETDKKLYMKNALIGGSIEIIKILQGYNIPVDISANYRGWSPLHNAAAANKPETMEFLVKYGMDINSRTIDGRSPYNIADENGHKELMKQIIKLGGSDEPQKFPVLKGLYLGQTPPVNEMKKFAPGIIDNIFSSLSFSADGKEIFWAANDNLITMRQENEKWSKPEILSFSGIGKSDFYDRSYDANPFISPDNKKLFFTSLRPPVKGKEAEAWKENIWVVERATNGFTDPVLLCKEVNEIDLTAGISVSNSGTIYFNGRELRGTGDWEIFYSSLADGEYTKPVKLSSIINSKDN